VDQSRDQRREKLRAAGAKGPMGPLKVATLSFPNPHPPRGLLSPHPAAGAEQPIWDSRDIFNGESHSPPPQPAAASSGGCREHLWESAPRVAMATPPEAAEMPAPEPRQK
jgi:hypothetical protein